VETQGIRYYRFNRAAYTVRELLAINRTSLRAFVPFIVVRLLFWKALRLQVPAKEPIAERRTANRLTPDQSAELLRLHPTLGFAAASFRELGIASVECFHWYDGKHPYWGYELCGLDPAGSMSGSSSVLTNGEQSHYWHTFASRLADGRTLQHFDIGTAGQLRPLPSLIIHHYTGLPLPSLYRAHLDERQRMSVMGVPFAEGRSLDDAMRDGEQIYADQIAYWIASGLLMPDPTVR
jgi:hypothetical protein